MKHLLTTLVTSASLSFGALLIGVMPANAATFTLEADGVLCEGPGNLLPRPQCDGVETFQDGPTTGNGELIHLDLEIGEHGTIFGGVRGRDDLEFSDRFQLVGSGMYKLTLEAIGFRFEPEGDGPAGTEMFDATWFLDDVDSGTIGNLDGLPTMLMAVVEFDGILQFDLTAAGGNAADNSIMEYSLKIEAIPLPAAAWMLLAGVGGLAAMKRRKKA
ncbi:MAG: VPLPA-CTERM sorting domain-containing protein [Pseudomonadota bacterium]